MSNGKSILVDTTLCTACRGCQIACKQWNNLPGTKTKQIGTYQNPQDFSASTWKLVRFAEGRNGNGNGKPYWYFFSDMCRHCMEPPCADAIQGFVKDGVIRDEATGAVVYTAKTNRVRFDEVRSSCPYDIPRQNLKTKVLAKCTMCIDRTKNNRIPACVQSCPTGAMIFGDRSEILAKVEKRVAELKKSYPKAMAINPEDVRVIFIVKDDPEKYWKHASV
jgi:formate dehydrogenase iron-sulfur subunit